MSTSKKPRFTQKQGRYLAFINTYTALHGRAPSEAEIQAHFNAAPSVFEPMLLTLERRGLISRTPGEARSIRVLVPPDELPPLGRVLADASSDPAVELVVETANRVVDRLFERNEEHTLDDSEFVPLIRCVARAAEDQCVARGVAPVTAETARRLVEDHAISVYVRLCAEHDPEGADIVEDMETFEYMMEHGRWPEWRSLLD